MSKVRLEGLDDLERAFERIKSGVDRILEAADQAGAEVVKQAANQAAPGPYMETEIKRVSRKRAEILIGPDKEHWFYIFFETGTTTHEIKPRNKKALIFEGAGMPVFAKRATVRGMAAAPFLRPALDRQGPILAAISAKLREVIK